MGGPKPPVVAMRMETQGLLTLVLWHFHSRHSLDGVYPHRQHLHPGMGAVGCDKIEHLNMGHGADVERSLHDGHQSFLRVVSGQREIRQIDFHVEPEFALLSCVKPLMEEGEVEVSEKGERAMSSLFLHRDSGA